VATFSKENDMSIEKDIRDFAREHFSARTSKIEGAYQASVRGNKGRVFLMNPDAVEEQLRAKCGEPIETGRNAATYEYAIGRGRSRHVVLLTLLRSRGRKLLRIEDIENTLH
jgi:hypothetical protein